MRSVGRTRPASKAKDKGNGGKGEHEGKGGGGFWPQRKTGRDEERTRRNGSEWRQTWGRWLTPSGHFGSGRGRGEQQRNEEKEEILRLLGEW